MGPVALAWTAVALAGVGAGVSALGSMNQANYLAQVANNNAQIQRHNAELATQAGGEEARQIALRGAAMVGAERAAAGASGIDPNSGSTLDVQSAQSMQTSLDEVTTRSNAALKAYGYNVAATSDVAQGQLDQMAGQNQAISSIMGGASQFADKWSSFQQNGVLSSGGSSAPDWASFRPVN